MKKRRIKSKMTIPQLLNQMLRQKPTDVADDEFWVFSIVRDDPDRPTWEERMQILGNYETCARQCVQLLAALRKENSFKSTRIESYHGEAARNFLGHSLQQEARYQKKTAAQPNN